MLLTLAYAQHDVSRLQATPQPGLPPKTTASCCLSACAVYWKQMDKDSWLSKFWCFSTLLSSLLSRGQVYRLSDELWKLPYLRVQFCVYWELFSVLWKSETGWKGMFHSCESFTRKTKQNHHYIPILCLKWAIAILSLRGAQVSVMSNSCMKTFMISILPTLFLSSEWLRSGHTQLK